MPSSSAPSTSDGTSRPCQCTYSGTSVSFRTSMVTRCSSQYPHERTRELVAVADGADRNLGLPDLLRCNPQSEIRCGPASLGLGISIIVVCGCFQNMSAPQRVRGGGSLAAPVPITVAQPSRTKSLRFAYDLHIRLQSRRCSTGGLILRTLLFAARVECSGKTEHLNTLRCFHCHV